MTAPVPAVYQLLGYPGVGKYTVGKALVTRLERLGAPARLVDNHFVANPILELVQFDGVTLPPPAVWERVRAVRAEVLRTINELSPHEWSFVFTNYWQDRPDHATAIANIETLARGRGSLFVPVVLECSAEELERRVSQPERARRRKLVDPTRARALLDEALLIPQPALRIDTTNRSPEETAVLITDRAADVADLA